MLEGKDFKFLYKFFQFVAACIDRVTGYQELAPPTDINPRYTNFMKDLPYDNPFLGWFKEIIANIDDRTLLLKSNWFETFGKHCEHGINTLKFHLLDNVVEELSKFWNFDIIYASPY